MSKHNKNRSSTVIYPGATGVVKCHTGNIVVMRSSKKDGGSLYCGGWSRGAFSDDMAVIDLTGTEPIDVVNPMTAKNESAAQVFSAVIASANQGRDLPWLAFKIKDFGVPDVGRETWVALANAISELMDEGHNVLMACDGGHGRTGTAAAIICYLLAPKIGDPVKYLRSVYCNDAVETYDQHQYVHKMLGLAEPERVEYKHDPKVVGTWQGWGGYVGYQQPTSWQPGYIWDSNAQKWVPPQPKGQETPPPNEGSGKREGWWLDDLINELKAHHIDYSIVQHETSTLSGLSSLESSIEVAMPEKQGLVYYRVVSYSDYGRTVKLEDIITGETRQIAVEFLATEEEVDKVYGKQ